jgi:hypothetical protein
LRPCLFLAGPGLYRSLNFVERRIRANARQCYGFRNAAQLGSIVPTHQTERQSQIADEFLRVLKTSGKIVTEPITGAAPATPTAALPFTPTI